MATYNPHLQFLKRSFGTSQHFHLSTCVSTATQHIDHMVRHMVAPPLFHSRLDLLHSAVQTRKDPAALSCSNEEGVRQAHVHTMPIPNFQPPTCCQSLARVSPMSVTTRCSSDALNTRPCRHSQAIRHTLVVSSIAHTAHEVHTQYGSEAVSYAVSYKSTCQRSTPPPVLPSIATLACMKGTAHTA
jgi:hypothetical protein